MSPRSELWLRRLMFLCALVLLVSEVIDGDWVRAAAWAAMTIYTGYLARPRLRAQA